MKYLDPEVLLKISVWNVSIDRDILKNEILVLNCANRGIAISVYVY